ncbi:MAG: outer membrane lipoprotein carrier protein LolA [Alphaproteobacteria bacterium]|nr:outer membrane lipoprotein carrier protein LolA [Alphaproteobacteria bacterium]MBQ7659198.1 outer membrane lipoprotein carrier protein LolA [Alphaproteobacteria bacterium]
MKKIFLLTLLFSFGARAQTAMDIAQIEQYLNTMTTLEADFVQMASNGATSEGKLYIEKPSKIRMEYAPPTDILIVGNGDEIIFHDKELDQLTNIDYEDIPGTKILTDIIKIDGKTLKIVDFYKDAGSTMITLEYVGSKDMGPITLVFSNNPFELKQWKIVDPQSVEVTLSLYNTLIGQTLDENLFSYKPKARKNAKRRR